MIVIHSKRLRTALRYVIPFIAIPLLVLLSTTVFGEKRHLFISLGVAVLAVGLFITGFERKITGSRRMVIVAVMAALCIAGRFLPFFKPVTALTILTAMYLGGEAGFLTGALAAVLSNFYFGQGPWTPFQMLGWGLIGLIAGYLHKPLKKSRALLLIFGFLSGALYSFVMDVWTILWYDASFNVSLYLSALAAALPHTLLYSVSNLLFLWLLAKPLGEKLTRVRLKYGV